jgi:hypothetical protein
MQIRIGGVVPQPHPVIVAEPVCMRMVQFQGKFVCFNPNTLRVLPMLKAFQFPHEQNFDQTGLFQSKHTESVTNVTTVSGYC